MQKRSKFIILISAIIVIALWLSVAPPMVQLFATDYHTGIPLSQVNNLNTEHRTFDVWKGQNCPGSDFPYKEMMPDTKYVTAFRTTGGETIYSERIAIQSNLFEDSLVEGWHPNKMYYNVFLNEGSGWRKIVGLNFLDSTYCKLVGGTSWKNVNYNPVGLFEQEIWAPAIEVQLKGAHVGALKVEAVFQFQASILPIYEDKTMAVDYVYLISGQGRMNIQGYQSYEVPQFEIGETVPIYVSADYSGPTVGENGRWQLWAFPLRGGEGRLIKEWNYDYFREVVQWQLPTDAWIRGSSDSRWRLELHNTLFTTDAIMVNTIDIKANAPPTPTVSYTPLQPLLGDPIVVSISGNTNRLTNESIVKYVVSGVYADTNYRFFDTYVPLSGATDPFPATVTVTPPSAGKFRLQVWAHDAAGRQSTVPSTTIIEVYQSTPPIPPIPPVPGDNLGLILVVVIAIIAVGGLGFYFYQRRGLKPKKKGKIKWAFWRK